MPRADLLALTPDDLAALTNRGTVKRAQREVEAGDVSGTVTEADDGSVAAAWSDGVACRLPAGVVLRDGACTCAAPGPCRHLVRTVLAYQRQAARSAPGRAAASAGPWDPGAFTDADLARCFRPAALARIRARFGQGVLVELVRAAKPSARFHLQACLVRFLVPGDLRYTHCDCTEPAPCSHVPLAVWAFRLLEPGRGAGVVAAGAPAPPAPAALLDDLDAAALAFTEYGASGAASAWVDRLTRLEGACREADLVWPAEILAEWVEQQGRYAAHDARFAPDRVAELVGELLIRCDAVRGDTGALPQLLIRGARSDRAAPLGAARFIGLGCGARPGRRGVKLTVYLQDADSGAVVAVTRDFADPPDDANQPPKPFADLALASAVKRTSFAALGAGQLLMRGGKRTAGYRLVPTRAEVSAQPQAFAWEGLRPPALVEDFAELDARLGALPPASLRPRRVAEDFHVLPVAAAEAAHFDAATQTVRAVLRDAGGRRVRLLHPYTSRGRDGAEALLALLSAAPQTVRYVSGPVGRRAAGLTVAPVCVVWQDGAGRKALQPWVERRPAGQAVLDLPPAAAHADEPLGEHLRQLQEGLGDLLVLGLQRADGATARRWRELARLGEATGLVRLAGLAAALAGALEKKSHTLEWDWREAGRALLRLAVATRMALDLSAAGGDGLAAIPSQRP
jgi:hypothetical protein